MRIGRGAILAGAALALAGTTFAQATDPEAVGRGLAIAVANCGRCHALGRGDASPHPAAPPFRSLHEKYPVEFLEEALAEGIFTGHPEMPQFVLQPPEIADFIAYLKSLEAPAP